MERPLELAFQMYQLLTKDEEYCHQWQALKELENKCRNSSNDNERFTALFLVIALRLKIKENWQLQCPISPYLKIKKEDLCSTVRKGSSLAKFMVAFGLGSPDLLEKQKIVKSVSKDKANMEKRCFKLYCSMLREKFGKSYTALARLFKVDKKTIKNWVDEVSGWPKNEKFAVLAELINSKSLPDSDLYDDENEIEYDPSSSMPKGAIKVVRPRHLQPIEDIDAALTSDGLIKTGRKSIPISPDE